MKILLSLFSILFMTSLVGQPLSGSFVDCNNNSRDIQTTLGSGKALIIAHKGVDCSICISQAPSLQTWANQNKVKVEVWAAMTWKYRASSFNPACQVTQSWVNTHSWTDIFTFPDSQRVFNNIGTPTYYVYSPMDSTIKYSGPNRSTAYSIALQESTVGVENHKLKESISWHFNESQLHLSNQNKEVVELSIYDLHGKLLINNQISGSSITIDLSRLDKSIYLLQFKSARSIYTEKVLIN